MLDAIVIGGGIVGTSAAYHLIKQGSDVLLIDRANVGRATDAGAGILSPETSGVGIDPAWFEFAVECVDYYPTLIQQLEQEQDGDTGYAVCGKLTVAVNEDEIAPFQQAQKLIFARQQQRGTPSKADLHAVDSEQAKQLFPPLAPVHGAIYYSGGARVDGRMLNAAMLKAATGLKHQNATAKRLIIEDNQVKGVVVDGESIRCGKVIIAGGAWSAAFGEQLGVTIQVEPKRGQIIHLSLPGVDTSSWPVVTAFHGHYLVPWPDERVVVGATREVGVGFNHFTTADGVREVLAEALRVAPGLSDAQFKEVRVGLRPHTHDSLPVLGEAPGIEGVYLATGHGATGLQLGPYSGKLAAEWVAGQASAVDISAFSVKRF